MLFRVVAGLVAWGLFAPCAGRALPGPLAGEAQARLGGNEGGLAACAAGVVLGAALGLLVVWSRRRVRTELVALGRIGRPTLAPWRLPESALWALAALGGASWPWLPGAALGGWLAAIALSLETGACLEGGLALGHFEPLGTSQLQELAQKRARERSGLARFDPASGLGLIVVAGCAAFWMLAPVSSWTGEPWNVALLCTLLTWVATSRLWHPRSLPEQVHLLVRAARSTRAMGCALGLLGYVANGKVGQPRLRVLPGARYAGLLRIELLIDTRRSAPALVLSVLVEVDSPAARWTCRLWPDASCERSAGGARMAFLKPVDRFSETLERLLEHFTREGQRAFEPKAQRAA